MKYLINGAGAPGSVRVGCMTRTGKDVTLLGRGEDRRTLQENGLSQMYGVDVKADQQVGRKFGYTLTN